MICRFFEAIALVLLVASIRSAPAADTFALRVATIPSDSGSDIFYANEEGFFKAAGLNVTIDTIANGNAIIAAVSSNSYDIGAANSVAIVTAIDKGVPIKIIAPGALHTSSAPTDLLMVPKSSPFRSGRDLNGKTVAVNSLLGMGILGIQGWISKTGGDPSTVRFVEIPFSAMGIALAQGRVDAAEVAEPFVTAAKDRMRILAVANNAISEHFLVDGWIASDSWLLQHADAASRFAAAMRRAHVWANSHHRESVAILARYVQVSPEVASTMTRATFGTTLEPQLLQPLLDTAAKYGLLPHTLPAANVFWAQGS